MPSRDPTTRKRLSGAAQKKLKRARNSDSVALVTTSQQAVLVDDKAPPIPTVFADVVAPPTGGVAAVEVWAAGLNLRCAVALETANALEAVRLVAVASTVKEIGKLKDKAARSEKTLRLRELRLGDTVDLSEPPYHDAAAIVLYACHKLAALAYEAATSPSWLPDRRVVAVKTLANCGYLPCNQELRRITDACKAA